MIRKLLIEFSDKKDLLDFLDSIDYYSKKLSINLNNSLNVLIDWGVYLLDYNYFPNIFNIILSTITQLDSCKVYEYYPMENVKFEIPKKCYLKSYFDNSLPMSNYVGTLDNDILFINPFRNIIYMYNIFSDCRGYSTVVEDNTYNTTRILFPLFSIVKEKFETIVLRNINNLFCINELLYDSVVFYRLYNNNILNTNQYSLLDVARNFLCRDKTLNFQNKYEQRIRF